MPRPRRRHPKPLTVPANAWRALVAGALVALGAHIADAAAARPVAFTAERIAVAPTALPDTVDFLVGYELAAVDPGFERISGVELTETRLIASTKGGEFIAIAVQRGEDGAIVGWGAGEITPQLDADGAPFGADGPQAEALALDPVSGLIWTAHELDDRILGRRELDAAAIAMIEELPDNVTAPLGGVRGLAVARDRSLIAIVASPVRDDETPSGPITGPVVGWRLAVDRAERFEIERSSAFEPTGADFGPDGAFYLLEAREGGSGRIGAFRIRRFSAAAMRDLEDGAKLGPGDVVLELTDAAPIGRMEALSVDAGADGGVVLTVIAGDGGGDAGPTRILQFQLTDEAAPE